MEKNYIFLSMTDRQTDKTMYILDAHMLKKLLLRILAVYLE